MAVPKTFTGGERLFAADLNDNFEALDAAVAAVQSDVDNNEANLNASNLNSGTVPAGRLPAGTVLQVVESSTSSAVTITSTSFTDTGLSATITPLYSSSKILVIASLAAEADAGSSSSFRCEAAITRGNTAIREWEVGMSFDGTLRSVFANSVLDSPSTTSATTYKGRARLISSGSSRRWVSQDNGSTSSIILMEIAA